MPKQTVTETEDEVRCSRCGKMTSKNARFCTSCGNPMSVAATEMKEEPKAEEPAEKTVPVTEAIVDESTQPIERKCPQCGAGITKDALFCTECGTKL